MSKYSLTIHSDKAAYIAVITALAEIVTHEPKRDSGLPVNAQYAIEWLMSQLESVEFDDPDSDLLEDYNVIYQYLGRVAEKRKQGAQP